MPKNKNIHNLTISASSHSSEASGIDGQFIPLPNTHVKIQQNTNSPLIQKKGTLWIESEIEIYQLIASNPKSAQKAILQPISTEKNYFESTLYLTLMRGGSLKSHQTYLFNQLNIKKINNPASSWLMQQLLSLLDTLYHLHTATFGLAQHKGIIHGDIKPDNILINKLGNCVLADFDCAYQANKSAHRFGSLAYTAPELFSNENFMNEPMENIDKSDIWSLGITLYRLLNNKFPDFFNAYKAAVKKNTKLPNFFQAKPSNTTDNEMQPETIDLEDNINSFIFLKERGGDYPLSPMAKQAKESLEILQNHKENNEAHRTPLDILRLSSIAMLSSIEDRPNAEELLTLLQAWQKHFCPSEENEYQQFISELLTHPSLNRETGDNKHLTPL